MADAVVYGQYQLALHGLQWKCGAAAEAAQVTVAVSLVFQAEQEAMQEKLLTL